METYTFYDRDGVNKRIATIDPSTGDLTITMENVLYTTTTGEPNDIKAIDPDGGPFFCKGFEIGNGWFIKELHGTDEVQTNPCANEEEDDDEEKTVIIKGKVGN